MVDLLNDWLLLSFAVRNALIIFALFSVIMAMVVVGTSVLMIVALRKVRGLDPFYYIAFLCLLSSNQYLALHFNTRPLMQFTIVSLTMRIEN